MSLDLGRNRLYKELEQLRLRWNEVERVWQDNVRDAFWKEHLAPLEAAILTTLAAADRVSPLLRQARQDCDDTGGL
jgi:hypothetical protein